MKTRFSFLLSLCLISLLYSCSSDDGGIVVTPDTTSFLEATVDGDVVKADFAVLLQDREFNGFFTKNNSVKIQRYVSSSDNRGYFITLNRTDLDSINYPLEIKYASATDKQSLRFVYYDIDNNPWLNNMVDDGDFSITLTKYENKTLEGTFEGNLYRIDPNDSTNILTKAISNGSFKMILKEFDE